MNKLKFYEGYLCKDIFYCKRKIQMVYFWRIRRKDGLGKPINYFPLGIAFGKPSLKDIFPISIDLIIISICFRISLTK